MLVKDKRRALRRWRSRCKWMRRLRSDWADHGWRRDPRPYGTRNIDGTSLCDCFFLDSKQALRFKDTPHPKCSDYECNPRKAAHGIGIRTIQEWRAMTPEDDSYRVRGAKRRERKRDALVLDRVRCSCGFLLRTRLVPARLASNYDWRGEKCEGCRKKRGEFRFVNNVLVAQPV